jgi:hypothetical protein
MIPIRRFVGLAIFMALPVILITVGNYFGGTIYDFAANLYATGLATAALSLLVHLIVVRRIFPRESVTNQIVGLAISGSFSFVIYDVLLGYTARFTFLQRQGSTVNWGDDGSFSGLPRTAIGFHWPSFAEQLPGLIMVACVTGVFWLPCLWLLERWTYAQPQNHQ